MTADLQVGVRLGVLLTERQGTVGSQPGSAETFGLISRLFVAIGRRRKSSSSRGSRIVFSFLLEHSQNKIFGS